MNATKLAVTVGIAASLLVACMPDFNGDSVGSKKSTSTKSDEVQCGGPSALTPEDPTKFPKCACAAKGGEARCIPKDKVPGNVSSQLDTCDEGGPGVCVPDPLVKSGGAAPPTCKSPFGEGRCMSVCVPEVAEKKDLLNAVRRLCDADERCVPCKNPLKGGEPTGVCEIGKPTRRCEGGRPASRQPAGPATPTGRVPYTGPAGRSIPTSSRCSTAATACAASRTRWFRRHPRPS